MKFLTLTGAVLCYQQHVIGQLLTSGVALRSSWATITMLNLATCVSSVVILTDLSPCLSFFLPLCLSFLQSSILYLLQIKSFLDSRLPINILSWCEGLWKERMKFLRFKNSKLKINLKVVFPPVLTGVWLLGDHKVKKTLKVDTCEAQSSLNVWFRFKRGEKDGKKTRWRHR